MRYWLSKTVWVSLLLTLMSAAPLFAGPVKIKVAAVTPEGSTWVNVLRDLASDIDNHTAGEVVMKIYAGGVSGDEVDVLRKMQVKRIDAAGFSGVGLGVILPEIRVLEAPLLFRSNAEIDVVRERLFDYFSTRFDQKGFVLLGFVEGGWVYLFSKQNLSEERIFRATKMWVWKGDRVAEMLLRNFGIRTTPLHVADVNTGLETGMIDSFYSPPLTAIAFQWHARVAYMLDYPMVDANAALLMTKRAFSALSPAHQLAVRSLALKHCRRLVELTRRDNREARLELKAQGIIFVQPGAGQLERFNNGAQQTYRQSIPALYSSDLFARIKSILAEYRTAAGKQ
jgi:TRAP-type C4-dicarboxylate transport system substrate-binding protein